MICKKCNGQGVVSKVCQLSGDEDDFMLGAMLASFTLGLSLLATTRLKDVRCPRCYGTGEVGRRE